MMAPPTAPPAADAAVLTVPQAETLAGFCDKSLKRWAAAGEPVGRFKQGRAVRYHRATLEAWLKGKADAAAGGQP